MKILWMSAHTPLESQKKELTRLFGEHELVIISTPFQNAGDVQATYKQHRADELVLVAPMTLIKHLLHMGIKPLYAEMLIVPTGSSRTEVRQANRCYRFNRFLRVVKIQIDYEELTPQAGESSVRVS